ncbi:Cytochrome c1, heme protein, mitochondrial [Eufriesea mexicana]|uniref:Cytochrome c1, heme protein, mitochondrial n=1 Tax=Eufriesea mexicana TaxID=516756 RepID=A0A310SL46_9HYME|nr:Cytochrome c1, heme protein, mitochondrial [Eufriesea mexicana]
MAIVERFGRAVSTRCRKFRWIAVNETSCTRSSGGKRGNAWLGILAGMMGSCGMVLYFLDESSVKAFGELEISLPKYPWAFNGVFKSFDHAALRRGWLIYRTVCHTCHSLQFVRFSHLIDVTHTIEEVQDGPDDKGNYYTRPGKLSDFVPSPYPNEEAARAANFGAYPPDLTYMILTRKRGLDYVFSLLTGWMDPPAGIAMPNDQYFNAYFSGGFTTMPRTFYDGMVEYDDDTPATESQMAKDVVEFLMWTASCEHDERKIMTLKCLGIFLILILSVGHVNRRNWSHMRSRCIAYVPQSVTRDPRLAEAPSLVQRSARECKRSSTTTTTTTTGGGTPSIR